MKNLMIISHVERALQLDIDTLEHEELRWRFQNIFRAAQFIHIQSKTDKLEYGGFLSGLRSALSALKKELS